MNMPPLFEGGCDCPPGPPCEVCRKLAEIIERLQAAEKARTKPARNDRLPAIVRRELT